VQTGFAARLLIGLFAIMCVKKHTKTAFCTVGFTLFPYIVALVHKKRM
jgi:hypothetical protein